MSNKIKLFICDDYALFRDGISAILRDESTIEIIGQAENGRLGVEAILRLKPDVALMDISMPELNGFEATLRIKQSDPNIKILILTMYDEEELIARCLDAGASGYVIKDVPAAQLIYAIQTVYKGGEYLSPGVAKKVVSQYVKGGKRQETSYDLLTGREREVLKLLADGFSSKEIASNLSLSIKTVDVHKYNLMRKLDLHDRSDIIKYAIQNKLIMLSTM